MKTSSMLVTGISGRLGRQAIEYLLERRTGPLIGTTRTPERHADLIARGIDVRYADFDDKPSVVSAFAGASRILLVSTNTLGAGDRRIRQHANAIEAATENGATQIVYTSFLQKAGAQLSATQADHVATEKILEACGLAHTCLRNAFYSDMLLVNLKGCIASGHIYSSAGDGRIPYVSHEDCALAAAVALTAEIQRKRIVDITGPMALNARELALIASEVFCKAITYVALTADERRLQLAGEATTASMANALVDIERWVSSGALDAASQDFFQLTQKKAMSVKEYLSANHKLFLS